jgi:predicted PurR-regulated permease PerM
VPDEDDARREAEEARDQAEAAREDAAEASQRASDEAVRAERAADQAAPPHDPILDTGVRRFEARADEDNPYGLPGAPLGEQSPFRIAFVATLGIAAAAALVESVLVARQVLILILIAAFLAVGLDPAVRWLVRRGLKRGIAVLVIILAAFGFVGGFVAAIAPPIAHQSTALVKKAPDYAERLTKNPTIKKLDDRYHFVTSLKKKASTGIQVSAFGGVVGVGKKILGIVFSTLTVVILTIYFLANMPAMKRTVYRLVPRSRRARVGGYVLGNLFTSLIAGLATLIWLEAWRIPYAVALALFVAVTDLIPLIGATIGAIGVTAVALFSGIPIGIATFAFYVGYQQFENYVLQPRVMKRTVDVAPVVTIVAALLGAALLGILGALIAVPLAAGVQLLLTEVAFPRQDEA